MKPPKAPKITPTPPPPTINQARIDSERDDAALRKRGRSATVASTPKSRMEGGIATKMLMGQGA